MATVAYVPAAFDDEIVPGPQADPAAFIHIGADGGYLLQVPDDAGGWDGREPVQIGSLIAFNRFTDFGIVTIQVGEDGTWMPETAIPSGASQFYDGYDNDTISESIDDFVRYSELPAGAHEVHCFDWSGPFAFCLERPLFSERPVLMLAKEPSSLAFDEAPV